MTVGEIIGTLRNEKKISLEDMSLKTKIKLETLVYYENNTLLPNIPDLINLSNFFMVSTDYLLGLSQIKIQNRDLQTRINYFYDMPPQVKDFFLEFLEFINERTYKKCMKLCK